MRVRRVMGRRMRGVEEYGEDCDGAEGKRGGG
jgi:hypothetical protein